MAHKGCGGCPYRVIVPGLGSICAYLMATGSLRGYPAGRLCPHKTDKITPAEVIARVNDGDYGRHHERERAKRKAAAGDRGTRSDQ